MIVITGASGFIGSCFTGFLNQKGYFDLVLVDEFSSEEKALNIQNKKYNKLVKRERFFKWLENSHKQIEFIFHLGARTDTMEFDTQLLNELNLDYSKKMWEVCVKYGIPLVYASSAATYGDGSYGYSDDHELCYKLKPLNPYGISKNEFDKWALKQEKQPYFWTGLKFFNVYGPNEYHKSRMASVIFHAYNQIQENKEVKLFRSHHPDFKDGEQKRDFVYIKDIMEVLFHFMHHRKSDLSGIYNLGTGKAETFNTLVESIFKAMELSANISYIDTPENIRDKYQYFTQAEINKLRKAGYKKPFTPIEAGVKEYVKEFLAEKKYM